MSNTSDRLTIRDLPLPAKLVVTTFLISIGLGYLWAMAQIHFKHASPGEPMPTVADVVTRFSGVPWPLEPKPEPDADVKPKEDDKSIAFARPGVRVKTVIDSRCVRCHKKGGDKGDAPMTNFDELTKMLKPNASHPKGRMFTALNGKRDEWDGKNMVAAFFEETVGWDKLSAEQQKTEEPKREAERRALIAWVEDGAKKETYEADAFPLPQGFDRAHLPNKLLVETDPAAIGTGRAAPPPKAQSEKTPKERWDDAKARQIGMESLTQSTHAHLLSFSMLWALTGIIFAFTNNSYLLRCLLSPIVLIAQVIDVSCWWLARLDGVGPYFAITIIATGAIVGIGLVAQITLSLWSMYGGKGRAVLLLMALAGASLFGLTYAKVIKPQLDAEKKVVAQPAK